MINPLYKENGSTNHLSSKKITELHLYPDHLREKNDYAWYKAFAEKLSVSVYTDIFAQNARRRSMKANYKLMNGRIELEDVIKNSVIASESFFTDMKVDDGLKFIDIVSLKANYLLGLEKNTSYNIRLYAVNPEATTKREKEKFRLYQQYVYNELMAGINEYLQQKYQEPLAQAAQNNDQEGYNQIMQQMEQEKQAMTPPEIEKYMSREYQTPEEILADQLLSYLNSSLKLKNKFSEGFFHAVAVANEIYKIDIENSYPVLHVVNPLFFHTSGNSVRVEDNDWAVYVEYLSIPEIVKRYGDRIDHKKFEKFIKDTEQLTSIIEDQFYINADYFVENVAQKLPVVHYVWKSLRKIGFLRYYDMLTQTEQTTIVDETYKFNEAAGDIEIEWKYINDVYEIYQIGSSDFYFGAGRVKRIVDLNKLDEVKLPYVGYYYNAVNDKPISILDKMKTYQYLHIMVLNQMIEKIEQNRGKKILFDVNILPKKEGYDVNDWLEMLDKLGVGFYDSKEEGLNYVDINQMAKQVDMSTTPDIMGYVNLLVWLDKMAGYTVGINENALGQIDSRQLVTNVQQSINQTLLVLKPYMDAHTVVQMNVIQQLVDTARYAFTLENNMEVLSYTLDDLSQGILKLDKENREILLRATYGIFPSNDMKIEYIMQQIVTLSQAALQAGQATFSDVVDVLRSDTVTEALEKLKLAEQRAQKRMDQSLQMQQQAQQEAYQNALQLELAKIEAEGKVDLLKEQERRKTQLAKEEARQKSKLEAPDIDESMKEVEQIIKERELQLRERKQQFDEAMQMAKLDLERQKIEIEKIRKANTTKQNID